MFSMLPFWGRVAPTYSYRGNSSNASGLSSYAFLAKDIGTAKVNRVVAVSVHVEGNAAANVNTTDCTIAGIAASEIVRSTDSAGNVIAVIWYAAVVPTGTTGNIAITLQAAAGNCSINVYALYDTQLATVLSGHDQTSGVSSATGRSVTLARIAGSIALGATTHHTNVRDTYAELTEDFDGPSADNNTGVASGSTTEVTGRASVVHTSTPASSTQQCFAVAVFQ